MLSRLIAAVWKLRNKHGAHLIDEVIDDELPHDVEFNPIEPGATCQGVTDPLLCPVTRQQIDRANIVFQCSECRTSYSKSGWEFLRDVNRGRCCACSARGTIQLLI